MVRGGGPLAVEGISKNVSLYHLTFQVDQVQQKSTKASARVDG